MQRFMLVQEIRHFTFTRTGDDVEMSNLHPIYF
jgi:hypothetical protein